MKEGWQEAKLGDVCEMIKRGVAPKYIDEGGICVINQKCIRDHVINYNLARRHNLEQKKVHPERYVRLSDVLVNSTGTGTLGRVAQVRFEPSEPTTVDTHVTIVRPKPNKFYPDFFGYMLVNIEDEIKDSGEGTSGQTELSRTKIENNFKVTYPVSIGEQKRIVTILDDAFDSIDKAVVNTEKNLGNAMELFNSYLNSVFERKGDGWLVKKLGDICSIKHGFAFKSKFFKPQGDYVVLTPGSFYEDGGFRDQGAKTKYYHGDIPDGFILNRDDFLIAMTEQAIGLLGSSLIVPESDRYLHNQRLGLVLVVDEVVWNNLFFHYQFNTKAFRDAVEETASGVKVRHTSPKKLYAITVAFPGDYDEQERIASELSELKESVQKLEAVYNRKLSTLAELKQSILQKAFSGELTADAVNLEHVA